MLAVWIKSGKTALEFQIPCNLELCAILFCFCARKPKQHLHDNSTENVSLLCFQKRLAATFLKTLIVLKGHERRTNERLDRCYEHGLGAMTLVNRTSLWLSIYSPTAKLERFPLFLWERSWCVFNKNHTSRQPFWKSCMFSGTEHCCPVDTHLHTSPF